MSNDDSWDVAWAHDVRAGKHYVAVTYDGVERASLGTAGWCEIVFKDTGPVPENHRKKAENMWGEMVKEKTGLCWAHQPDVEIARHRWVPVEACDSFIEESDCFYGSYIDFYGIRSCGPVACWDGEWVALGTFRSDAFDGGGPKVTHVLNPHLGPIPDVEEG